MGFLNDLFGDEAARDRAMAQGFEDYRDSMSSYLTEFEDRMLATIADVRTAEQADIRHSAIINLIAISSLYIVLQTSEHAHLVFQIGSKN